MKRYDCMDNMKEGAVMRERPHGEFVAYRDVKLDIQQREAENAQLKQAMLEGFEPIFRAYGKYKDKILDLNDVGWDLYRAIQQSYEIITE